MSTEQPTPKSEMNEKLALIDYSYKEVLDATKHQDDKIGQLLTSIAFLTAATLALAALESGNFITRPFAVAPYKLPLALIALVVFLIGVAWSVMLLIASLSTPLRIPGIAPRERDKPVDWERIVHTSQIYFYGISQISLDQWEKRWTAPTDELKQQRLRSMIRETHNLGVRTRAKYDRTTEAVALLSVALLAFALSIIFVAIAAGTPDKGYDITLNWWQRLTIGLVFGCYVWLQTLGQIRYNRQAVDEARVWGDKSGQHTRSIAENWYAATIALLMIDMIEYDKSWQGLGAWGSALWISVTIILTLTLLVAFLFISSNTPRSFWDTWCAAWRALTTTKARPRQKWFKGYWPRLTLATITITIGITVAVIWCGIDGIYSGQLSAASFIVILIIGTTVTQPTRRVYRDRKNYWNGIVPPYNLD